MGVHAGACVFQSEAERAGTEWKRLGQAVEVSTNLLFSGLNSSHSFSLSS